MLDISTYVILIYTFLGVVLATLYKRWLDVEYPKDPFNVFHFFGFVIFWMPLMGMALVENLKRRNK